AGLIDHEREALRKSDHRNAIRSHEHFEELCAQAGLRVAQRRYYNVVFKALVEDLGLRLWEQWRRTGGPAAPADPPGGAGGEVARGLAARGHEVHAVVRADGRPAREEEAGVVWHRVGWSPPHRLFRFRARPAVDAIAEAVKPAAVMERYYNFGGEGVRTASRR